ncbi:MAG: hypothetical protein ACP5O1_05515 [Phycisphaerae bacterium]
MGFRISQIFFWLSLSIYFGGLAILGPLAAYEIFTIIPKSHATVPGMSPTLDQPKQLAGDVFGHILKAFNPVELTCAGILLAAVLFQTVFYLRWKNFWNLFRVILVCLIAAVTLFDRFYTFPRVWRDHKQWVENADRHPAQAAAHRKQFEILHAESEHLGEAELFLLLALLLVSAATTQGPEHRADAPPTDSRAKAKGV